VLDVKRGRGHSDDRIDLTGDVRESPFGDERRQDRRCDRRDA